MKPELKGPLPDDFPGRAALADEGITSYGKLRRVSDVTAIPGIGASTAEKIKAALEGSSETDAQMDADVASEGTGSAAAPGATTFEPPAAPIKVTCPKCGVGGELAGAELLGVATCGDPKHPDVLLVRA
jgi:hypothetical protein